MDDLQIESSIKMEVEVKEESIDTSVEGNEDCLSWNSLVNESLEFFVMQPVKVEVQSESSIDAPTEEDAMENQWALSGESDDHSSSVSASRLISAATPVARGTKSDQKKMTSSSRDQTPETKMMPAASPSSQVLLDPTTTKALVGWVHSPLLAVGAVSGDLRGTPSAARDFVSQFRAESQSYTSWDCVSRLYVSGAIVRSSSRTIEEPKIEITDLVSDTPTAAERQMYSAAHWMRVDRGKAYFKRGQGILTAAQIKAKYAENVPTPPQPATADTLDAASGSSESPRPESGFKQGGYYYSDTIPVKVCAVSHLTNPQQQGEAPQFSALYHTLAAKFDDPSSSGVLASVVRGPNVKDTQSLSLVKAVMLRPSSHLEVAAMVRCMAMQMSLAQESYELDPIPYRFIHRTRVATKAPGVNIRAKPDPPEEATYTLVATTVDTFVALANNTWYNSSPPGYSYAEMDSTWVAVPITAKLIGQSHLVPYIAAFMTSNLWSGTVTYTHDVVRTFGGKKSGRFFESYMPAINSVHIPGPTRVMLVIMDKTATNTGHAIGLYAQDHHLDVPIWVPGRQGGAPDPVDFWPLWEQFWDNDNTDSIRRDTQLAYNFMCERLGVGECCPLAVSIVSELYGVLYNGLSVPTGEMGDPDYTKPAYGAWSTDGGSLDPDGFIESSRFPLLDDDKRDARRLCAAYNWSSLSPLHLVPTGVSRTAFRIHDRVIEVTWATQEPERTVPTYTLSTASSVWRVAIMAGLINPHEHTYRFGSPQGMTHWIHMLAAAQAFTTAAFFVNNDLSPKDWAGFDNRYDIANRLSVISTLKRELFAGIVQHHSLKDLWSSLPYWDHEIISDYYVIDVFDNDNWLTYSPLPTHVVVRWCNKLKMGHTGNILPPDMFRYGGRNTFAATVPRDAGNAKLTGMCTTDRQRLAPIIYFQQVDEPYRALNPWFDQFSPISNLAARSQVAAAWDFYEDQAVCPAFTNIGIAYTSSLQWKVKNGNWQYGQEYYRPINASPLMWPDPPSLRTIWEGAKYYLLKPAASTLVGFLTGGPAGAVIAGGAQVARQLVVDLSSKEKISERQDQVTQVAKAAAAVTGTPVPQTSAVSPTTESQDTAAKPKTMKQAPTTSKPSGPTPEATLEKSLDSTATTD